MSIAMGVTRGSATNTHQSRCPIVATFSAKNVYKLASRSRSDILVTASCVVARENLRDGSYADPDPNQVVEWGRINARERANESERQAHFKRETAREQPLFNNGVPPPITSFGQAHKDGRSRPAPANARFDAVKFGSHERANRLERENRITQRESAQPHGSSSSALPPGGPGKGGATPRKCANCGEVGHIKTNTKQVIKIYSVLNESANTIPNRLCPLLNGQRKQNDTFRDANASAAVGDSDNINKESRLAPPNAPP
ncbi:unnamed protein product [Alternaria alternata]